MTGKRFSRRELLQLTGAGASAAMLAACQVQPVGQTVEVVVTAPAPEGPAHLKFWYWWGSIWGEACTAFANKFMEDNDDVYIEPLPLGGRMERILAAFASGEPPDLLLTVAGGELPPRGLTQTLDNLIDASTIIDLDNYLPGMLDTYQWEGELHALPGAEAFVDVALIINKGLAEEAGLDPSSPPETMSEILAWSEAMAREDPAGGLSHIGFDPLAGTGSRWYNWAGVYGVEWWDRDNLQFHFDVLAEALDWSAQYLQAWGPDQFEAFRAGHGGWLSPDSPIALGLEGLHVNGYWTPGELFHKADPEQEYIYAWPPTSDDRKGVKYQTSLPFGCYIAKASKYPDACFRVLEFMSTDEANEIFYNTAGGFAATRSWLEKVDTSLYPGIEWYVKSAIEAEEWYTSGLDSPIWMRIWGEWSKAQNAVIYGEKTATEALEEMNRVTQDQLDSLLQG